MDSEAKRNRRPLLYATSLGLLVITVFGALSEGGVLFPRFRLNGSGLGTVAGGPAVFNTLQNVSPRSWTMTGIHLTDKASTAALSDVRIVRLALQSQVFPPSLVSRPPSSRPLTVSAGQQFTAYLVAKVLRCPPPPIANPADPFRFINAPQGRQHLIPAVITVSTPLGTRTVGTTFTIGCPL